MDDRQRIYGINADLARAIDQEARADPNSPYRGKFVGIANGQVVAVADSAEDVLQKLDAIEPDSMRTCFVEAGLYEDEDNYIWKLH